MSLLAHDRVWGDDDWLMTAIVPPGMFLLSLALIAAILRDREEVKMAAIFLGVACGLAALVMWSLVGICWLAGCL